MQGKKAHNRAIEHRNKHKYSDKMDINTPIKQIWAKYVKALETLVQLQEWENMDGQSGAVRNLVAQIKSYRTILRRSGELKR